MGQLDAIQRLGERTNLVHLDENRVGHAQFDAFTQEFGISYEIVVTDKLNLVADFVGEFFPCCPIVFGTAVFDADNWVFGHELGVKGDQVVAADGFAGAFFEKRIGVAGSKSDAAGLSVT